MIDYPPSDLLAPPMLPARRPSDRRVEGTPSEGDTTPAVCSLRAIGRTGRWSDHSMLDNRR